MTISKILDLRTVYVTTNSLLLVMKTKIPRSALLVDHFKFLDIVKTNVLHGQLVIVDECHHFSQMLLNDS